MSIITQTANSQNLPNVLPDTGFVGVGTTTPSCNFQVIGQSQISGNLTVDSSITIADSANVNNNLRVNGDLFVAKNAYITDTTFSKAIRVKRITPQQGDSLIYFGDSSLVINSISHLIYPSVDIDVPNPIKKGMGIGTENHTPKAENSVSVGHRINIDANAKNSIAIGTGVIPTGPYLQQYIPNSIMLGTNSNLPTLFISPANGPNTLGKVGIGTLTPVGILHVANGNAIFNDNVGIGPQNPSYKLEVCGTIKAKEVIIEATNWCDFKLKPDYTRMTWQEKLDYIETFGHLPEIDSGSEIESNGLKTAKNLRGMIWNIEDNTILWI